MTADVEDQDQRAVLVCHHSAETRRMPTIEFTVWADKAEARQAAQELPPCSKRCVGVHTVARIEVGAQRRAGLPATRRTTTRGRKR